MKPIQYVCTVTSVKQLTPTVFESSFTLDQEFSFDGGQFISIIIPGAGPSGRDLRRAYSIASAPEKRPVELCVKLVEGGPGTNYLYGLKAGDQFKGLAPYGTFTYRHKPGRGVCFVSTGTGLAPFRSMALSSSFRDHPPTEALCLLGVRTEDELLYADSFAQVPHVQFVSTVSQPQGVWNGFRGRVTDYLRQLPDSYLWKETEFYLCGNGAMITEVKALLAEHGVLKESIHQEVYYK